MKKRLLSLLLLCTLVFALSGCGEKTLLNKKKPVSLSFWHVYGEQAGSPMDLLVQEFNRTVGQERGVQVQVTGMSSASQIGGYLKDAQSGGKDVQEMPDLFTCHIVDALELGEDNLVPWNEQFTPDELSELTRALAQRREVPPSWEDVEGYCQIIREEGGFSDPEKIKGATEEDLRRYLQELKSRK